jgi:zeaxanthin glucosyltransferase
MTHFGLICPASTGHLNTMLPLGKELQRRGHQVTLFGKSDAQAQTLSAGLEFQPFGESDFPVGSGEQMLAQLGKMSGLPALRYTIKCMAQEADVFLRDIPEKLRHAGVQALLIDQVSSGGTTVAELLNIPFITVCSAVVTNSEEHIPPFFTNWGYGRSWWAKIRNRMGYNLLGRLTKPVSEVVAKYRQEWKLPLNSDPSQSYSPLAVLSQQPAELEFPRKNLPQYFHFTGPYHSSVGRPAIDFPFEKLTGQPLIYASMGTIQNRLIGVFQNIAEACVGLNAQLVISLGGSAKPESLPKLSGSPLVVEYAPQLELLQKATLTITHAGMNTTLECLNNGIPMVAIPITNDQPGIATRIAWAGAGEVIPLSRLSVGKLRRAVQKVLAQESYKQNAVRLQESIGRAGGVSRAIDIVEQAISIGKPVFAETQR